MPATPERMIASVKPVQFLNEYFPISETLPGMVTFVRLARFWKAYGPMLVTPDGTVNSLVVRSMRGGYRHAAGATPVPASPLARLRIISV